MGSAGGLMIGRTRPPLPRWLLPAIALAALALTACGPSPAATTNARPATATPPATAMPPAAASPTPHAPAASPPAAQNDASRWGFHPGRPTGKRDRGTLFSPLPAGYRIETYVAGLKRPASIAFLPDGRMLVAEQEGAIRVVTGGRLWREPLYEPDVFFPDLGNGINELGLVGITVDPAFADNGYIYAYFTTDTPNRRTVLERIRIVRGRVRDTMEVLSMRASPRCCHIAGGLRFAPDGTLFVGVGDHLMETESQDLATPFGSILRIRRDGSAPPDNPFAADEAADPRVYAYGLRNPFGIAIDPDGGRIFATENGFLGQDAIIEVTRGANYGWPGYQLSVPLDQVEPPLLFYHEALGPAGIEFYRGDMLSAFDGTLFFCHFHRGGALHAVTLNETTGRVSDTVVAPGCTSSVLTGPDGYLYFVDYIGGVVYRIAKEATAR